MTVPDSYVLGTVFYSGTKEQLAKILTDDGFTVTIGQWALRLENCARTFEIGYVGNPTSESPFQVEGNGFGVSVDLGILFTNPLLACSLSR